MKNPIPHRMARANIPFVLAQLNSHAPNNVRLKSAVIQILYWIEHLSQQQIARMLHTNQSNVSRIMKKHSKRLEDDPIYRDIYENCFKSYEYAKTSIP